jgi:hypothetical protein
MCLFFLFTGILGRSSRPSQVQIKSNGVKIAHLQMLTIKYNLTLPHQPDSFHIGRPCGIKFSFNIREKQDSTRLK